MTALFRRHAAESPSVSTKDDAEEQAEKRRMSSYDLFFLAAGGVIGSGWLLGEAQANLEAGSWSIVSWLIGGALMLVIAAVMVELSVRQPKTGGLIFLPLQTSGPLLATVVAAGLWVFYAVNPASEAAAMVRGIVGWTNGPGLVNTESDRLTWEGIGLAMLLILLVTSVNLLGPRLFLLFNMALTLFKIAVPLVLVVLLAYGEFHHSGHSSTPFHGYAGSDPRFDPVSILTTMTSSGVIYAYLGFQGPLDFAGSIKTGSIRRYGKWRDKNGRDKSETVRLRRAVYGTVCGSIFLYVALEFIIIYLVHHGVPVNGNTSPYTQFVKMTAPSWLAGSVSWALQLDTVLSPAGSALVFTYVLTREVAALSRAHLTHRGLQKRNFSVIRVPGGSLDVYWLILIIDFILSGVTLLCCEGKWIVLGSITSILALVVYATPSVVLAALDRQNLLPIRLTGWRRALPMGAFVSIAVVFFLAGWDRLWPGMAALTVGCVVLFTLPVVTGGSRWYDATAYIGQFRERRRSHAAKSALGLFGFFAGLALGSLPNKYAWPKHPVFQLASALPVIVLAMVVFRYLVSRSADHMEEMKKEGDRPMLPNMPESPEASATARSG